jgi:hypothetical protein
MAATVPSDRRAVPVKSLDLPLIGAVPKGQTKVNSDDGRWILALIGRAIDRAMSRKEAAIRMGVDQGLMTRQLSGDGHLSALRLGVLPEAFWLALADELRDHFGMLDRAQLIEQGESLIDRGRQLLARAAQR